MPTNVVYQSIESIIKQWNEGKLKSGDTVGVMGLHYNWCFLDTIYDANANPSTTDLSSCGFLWLITKVST